MEDTRMTICQMLVGLSLNGVYSWFGRTGRMMTVTRRNFIVARNSTLLSRSTYDSSADFFGKENGIDDAERHGDPNIDEERECARHERE